MTKTRTPKTLEAPAFIEPTEALSLINSVIGAAQRVVHRNTEAAVRTMDKAAGEVFLRLTGRAPTPEEVDSIGRV